MQRSWRESRSLLARTRQLGEHAVECFLGLVEDQDGASECGGDVIGPASAQRFESAPAVVSLERNTEQVAELTIEVHGARLGVLDGADDDVAQSGEALAEQAQGDTLAGTRVAGDHDIAAISDAELDAAQEGIDGGCDVQRFDGDVGAERVELQAVEGLQLWIHSWGSSSAVS